MDGVFVSPERPLEPNVSPAHFVSTLNRIPRNASLLGKTRLPFGVTVTFYPAAGTTTEQVPEVRGPIVRCRRCRAYLNPFVDMVEQGARWRCNMCFLVNEFPPNYDYSADTGQYQDRSEHPELKSFVYDFTNAPIEYTVRPPQPSVFVFVLDVTGAAVTTGLVATACRVIQEQLDAVPNEDGRARAAFIAFDGALHFFQLAPGAEEARVLVVADAGDPFLPAASDLLVNVAECRAGIDRLLDQLPGFFATPSKASPAFGPALQAAHMLAKSSGGKVVAILASLPMRFDGALRPRDDPRLLGTPKESALLLPANQFYKLFASEIVKDQIAVDLFLAPPAGSAGSMAASGVTASAPVYIDVATLSGLCKYTGGKLHYYPGFDAGSAEGDRFAADLRRFLGQDHGLEAVLRIRASQGISLSAYHGSFFLRQSDLLALPNVNPDHSFSAQASIDETLVGNTVSFQAALLHTSARGERRIRVINYAAPITDDLREVFAAADFSGLTALLPKMAAEKVLANRLEDAREAVLNKCADIIAAFKAVSGLKNSPALLLPPNLRLLPLALAALVKSPVLRAGSTVAPDLRAHHLALVKTLSSEELRALLLPRFMAIHSMDSQCGVEDEQGRVVLPPCLNLSSERLERHGVFLIDSGLAQLLWIGSNVHPELCQLLFAVPHPAQIATGRVSELLPTLDNDWSRRVRAILEHLRQLARGTTPVMFVVREDSDPVLRHVFMSQLVEDKYSDATPSYAQWLADVTTKANNASI